MLDGTYPNSIFVNVIYCHQQHHDHDSLMPIRNSQPKQMDDIFELDYQSCINLVPKKVINWAYDENAPCERVNVCWTFVQAHIVHVSGAFCCYYCCRCAVVIVTHTLLLLLLLLRFLLWMFYQHGEWVEKTGESPPRVWRCTLCSMHTGYTHAHSHTNTASFHSFTLSCLLACCCCVLFPSLFTRRAALRCTACAEQSSCYSHSWETGKKQTITHLSGRRLVQAFTFSHSFRRARSTIALRVHVCARLSLIPSFTVLSRHMCALVYVCVFFRFSSF